MPYNPNEPRDAEGKWTDAGVAIKNAASDKKIISKEKIDKVAKEWSNFDFRVWEKNDTKRLYISHRKTECGYIDLVNQTVVPNQSGRSWRNELNSILNDLTK